jgi:2'-5' RNA ligase
MYQEPEADSVYRAISEVARRFAPIRTHFVSVARFPDTGLFYYQPDDAAPFAELQKALVETKLNFNTSPFPFTPHCTIADFGELTDAILTEMMQLPVPKQEIILDTLSVYTLDGRVLSGNSEGCQLLYQVRLGGAL